MRKLNLIFSLVFCFVVMLFSIRGMVFLDPDFGWHLRLGQIFTATGIPKHDPFAYTMPSYPFIDHEWLSEVVIAFLYPIIGYVGLAVVFAAVAVLAVGMLSLRTNNKIIIPLFVLASTIVISTSGVRPQVISWLFIAILYIALANEAIWRRWKLTVPFLFLLWANMHGAFASGILLLGLWTIVGMFEKKKLKIGDLAVLIVSMIATFINPFGISLWHSVWLQAADSYARIYIQEWYPSFYSKNVFLWVYFALSGFVLLRYFKAFLKQELVVYLVFFTLGVINMRHTVLWIIISLPITLKAILLLKKEASKIQYGAKRFDIAYFLFFGIIFVLGSPYLFNLVTDTRQFSEKMYYPTKLVSFLVAHPTPGNIFSPYEWNGYLIWKIPSQKVFVYGMMPSWKWVYSNDKESEYAFRDYNDILAGQISFKKIAVKYMITRVAIPRNTESTQTTWMLSQTGKSSIDSKRNSHEPQTVEQQVKALGWQVVYEDEQVIVYQKI